MPRSANALEDHMPDLLLVEDNPLHVRLVQTMLAEVWPEGDSLRIARRLDAAILEIEKGRPECVLLDLVLPDADHLDAVKGLLAVIPDVPIVVLSAHEDDDLAVTAVAEGAQDYLVKGVVSPHELARTIRFAVNRQTPRTDTASAHSDESREIAIGLAVLDTAGTIRLAEPSLVDAIGLPGADLVGRNVADLSHPEDAAAWEPVLSRRAGTGVREVSIRMLVGNDAPVPFRVELTAMTNGTTTPAAYLALYFRLAQTVETEPLLEVAGS